jgi:hypothetical protein
MIRGQFYGTRQLGPKTKQYLLSLQNVVLAAKNDLTKTNPSQRRQKINTGHTPEIPADKAAPSIISAPAITKIGTIAEDEVVYKPKPIKSRMPNDSRADKIRTKITSACVIGATMYAEKYNIPVFYFHSSTGLLLMNPLEQEAVASCTAPWRDFRKGANAMNILAKLYTGQSEFSTNFMTDVMDSVNRSILRHGLTWD